MYFFFLITPSIIMSSPIICCLRCSKASLGNDLVKILALCSFESTYSNLTTFWDTCSLRKCYLIGKHFILECMIGFFDILIALVFSYSIIIGCSYLTSKYSSVCFIQITWVQQDSTVMYSASTIEWNGGLFLTWPWY